MKVLTLKEFKINLMTKHIDKKKLQIIEDINSIASEEHLDKIASYLSRLKYIEENKDIFKGIRDSVTIEELAREQDYKGIDKEEFDKLVKELNIQEPIEDLLAQLD